MRRLIVYTVLAGFGWTAAQSEAAPPSVAPGFLEGRLKVHVSGGARVADDAQPKDAQINYADYPLLVLRKDNREEIARISADENGHYRVPLPPGDYLLELKSRVLKRIERQLRPFTIVSQQTVKVDMELVTGLSVSGAPR